MSETIEMKVLLREALAPVEPPEALSAKLESTLESITEMAAEELDSWELSAMRDPRNWARPAAAALAGAGAGTALVVLRIRRRSTAKHGLRGASDAAGRGLRDAGDAAARALRDAETQARRLLGR